MVQQNLHNKRSNVNDAMQIGLRKDGVVAAYAQHMPMKIERATFEKLLDFVEQFPHYFAGSNSDLPIVGGAILRLGLVLCNNITTEEHPLGIYHPHEKLHNIQKENIGLIEVIGLAVLPAGRKSIYIRK